MWVDEGVSVKCEGVCVGGCRGGVEEIRVVLRIASPPTTPSVSCMQIGITSFLKRLLWSHCAFMMSQNVKLTFEFTHLHSLAASWLHHVTVA